MTPFAIAGVQMPVSASHENVSLILHKVDLVMAQFPWVQMILFSELAPYGPLPESHPENLQETLDKFRDIAVRYGIWLIPGSMFEREGEALYNTAFVINPQGEIVGKHRKMFPFMPYEKGVTGGKDFLVFDVPNAGRFGLSVCYDIWFPETTRTLTAMGAEVLLHPVLTATIDRDVELSIARSTAVMFQCYVFDINGMGAGGKGRSCVIDPSGSVLQQAGAGEEIMPVEIDFDQVRRQRAVGMNGLGQVLKSFRDREVEFDIYDRANSDQSYLNSIGPLEMPEQGTRNGLDMLPPISVVQQR